jgi:hypothetical protein
MGNRDGEEDNAEPSMDEGRGAHVEGVCAREDKDGGERVETYAERGCDVWSCVKVGRDAGRRSEEEGVRGSRHATHLYGRATECRRRKKRGTAYGLSNWT